MLAGGTFAEARSIVFAERAQRLKRLYREVEREQVLTIIDPWALVRRKGPNRYVDNLRRSITPLGDQNAASSKQEPDKIRPGLPTARLGALDLLAPRSVVENLVKFEHGEMPVLAIHVHASLSEEVRTRFRLGVLPNSLALLCKQWYNEKRGRLPNKGDEFDL